MLIVNYKIYTKTDYNICEQYTDYNINRCYRKFLKYNFFQ